MKLLAILSLLGSVSLTGAQPAEPENQQASSSTVVDLEPFRLPILGDYINSFRVKSESVVSSLVPQGYVETATELVRRTYPGLTFRLVEDHYIGNNGIGHVNFKQTVHGIDIDNADLNVNVGKDGRIFSYGDNFYTGNTPASDPLARRAFSDPTVALKRAVDLLQLPIELGTVTASRPVDGVEEYVLGGTSGTESPPRVKLAYFVSSGGDLKLTWRVETDIMDHWLLTYVDAETNEGILGVVNYVSDATYQVFPWGVNDPTEGDRIVVTDPWDLEASEFTWISDGTTNYTTTRGNNGIAQDNPWGGSFYLLNYRPDSPDLRFEYPYDPTASNPRSYRNASITQLFYTANKYHDLLYLLGFTEKAGNFQINNNGKGGFGGDFVILNAQDGSGRNNANFASPPDGMRPRMRMYLWNLSTPQRDCTFEAGVVIHEYTHGLSTRLTGGPWNSNCLGALESGGMGEGWGDFMATAIRLKKGDTRATDYTMGAWIANDPRGIRKYPYSTSQETNPYTYTNINTMMQVHQIGEVWATMLYEVLWNLIDKYGKNDGDTPEFGEGGVPKDGKYLAMKLVIDAMALQPCNPTFIQARDAILDADTALTQGANHCEIWRAFAKRGLGEDASQILFVRRGSDKVPSGVCPD